jgi:pyruvate dehydrogenase E2 component (dihydrolipoamide acetyltransferase)
MTIEIFMPALSPTMTEGNLAKWHKQEGDTVVSGDIIAEIETDKATMEVEAVEEGVLGRILVAEGSENVAVNTAIAVMLEEGEDVSALDAVVVDTPAPAAEPAPAPPVEPVAVPVSAAPSSGDRAIASPLARRMATQSGLDIGAIAGRGPRGRVVKTDVEAALASGVTPGQATVSAPTTIVEAPGMPAYIEAPNSAVRKIIAQRLTESKREAPHFYLTVDCHIDALLEARKELNSRSPAEGPDAYKISVNDFVVRATALALGKVPAANASWTDAAIRLYQRADISVAVAIDEGLITPIIHDAGSKGLATISAEMKDLAARARDGKLAPEEFQGGTFSISNLGMFGVKEFAAVINPPQGAILAVGMGEQRPVVRDGALAVATVMSCTLSVDHRVVDGAVGAQFLAAFKALIEDPLTMLL